MVKSEKKKKLKPQIPTNEEVEEPTQNPAASGAAAAEVEQITVKVEVPKTDPDKTPPIVGYFPTGYDLLKNSEAQEPEASVKVYKNVRRTNRYQVKVSPHESNVDFVGTNYAGEASRPQLCSYALGVFDKATQTLKIVPVVANKIFRLEPKVGGLEQPEAAPVEALTEKEKAEAVKNLHIKYSSGKIVKEYKKREALFASEDAETKQDLNRKVEHITMSEEALVATTVNDRNLPPYNLDATDPNMAYPLGKIIFEGEWDYLVDIYHLSQSGAEVSPQVYPKFVCNRVHKLDSIKDDWEKRRLAGILSFITHLIRFKDKYEMDGVKSAARHRIPSILFVKFSALFGLDSGSTRLLTEKIELLIGYILVLTLFVDDFQTDLTDIANDLRRKPYDMRAYYQNLGCKLRRENQLLLATLPVPLKFPAIKRRRR